MGDIKSAREIAFEKASKLGELKSEEIVKYKQEKMEIIVQALIEKYLTSKDSRLIEIELNKYKIEEQVLIKELICRKLLDLLNVDNQNLFDIIYQGFNSLSADSMVLDKLGNIGKCLNEYIDEREKEKARIDKIGHELFQTKGISGSAVGINVEVHPELKTKLDKVAEKYKKTIDELKQYIITAFQSQ